VDDEDFERLAQYRWNVSDSGHARRSVRIDGKVKTIYMHHEILTPPPGKEVDHRNCNPLDNRRDNLRIATRGQNNMNKGAQSNSVTGIKGVSFDKRTGKFHAKITVNGSQKFLGYFKTKEQAEAAYAEAAKLHHGDFHRLN